MEEFSAIFHAQYLFIFEDRVKVGGVLHLTGLTWVLVTGVRGSE